MGMQRVENTSTEKPRSLQRAGEENASTNTHRTFVAIGPYIMSLSGFAEYRNVRNVRPRY